MIELFRKGTSHVVNGINCERQTVNEFGFEHYLEEEWYLTPEECYKEEPVKAKPIEKVKAPVYRVPVTRVKEAQTTVDKKA